MMSRMKNKLPNQVDAVRSIRRDFSALNLKTRAITDKTKYSRKQKHRNFED